MISDAYDLKEVDGTLYEADCAMIAIKQGADVGMYFLSGGGVWVWLTG